MTDTPFGYDAKGRPVLRMVDGSYEYYDGFYVNDEVTPARVAGPDEVIVKAADLAMAAAVSPGAKPTDSGNSATLPGTPDTKVRVTMVDGEVATWESGSGGDWYCLEWDEEVEPETIARVRSFSILAEPPAPPRNWEQSVKPFRYASAEHEDSEAIRARDYADEKALAAEEWAIARVVAALREEADEAMNMGPNQIVATYGRNVADRLADNNTKENDR